MKRYDVVVVGAGIVGLSTAMQALDMRPDLRIAIVDKEPEPAHHQTGHNSGVLHSGLYYRPGSLKARLAVSGRAAMVEFAAENGIPHDVCGKIVVATTPDEVTRMRDLAERGRENGVPCTELGPEGLREHEPNVAGIGGLHVPSTGIIDFIRVCEVMSDRCRAGGAEILLGREVLDVHAGLYEVIVETSGGDLSCGHLVNCAGLQSDRVAAMTGEFAGDLQIVPFRGEYYDLVPQRRSLVRNLIYPVPDPAFPFLGVHFTRTIDGGVEVGPNAVLALAREGYRWRDADVGDLTETVTFPGFRQLAARYWRMGLAEMYRSVSKQAFVRALQCLVPAVESEDLERAPAGVRAQALRADGALVDDFAIEAGDRVVNVLNAPSPAATASLPIGRHVADLLLERLGNP